jgi:hypothetical protein
VGVARRVFGGLEGGEGGGFWLFGLLLFVAFEHLLDHELNGTFLLFGFSDLGRRGKGA